MQTPLGINGHARPIEGNMEVQCKLRDLIQGFAETSPETTLEDLNDFNLLVSAGVCEEHIFRLSMRYERTVDDLVMDAGQITVKMVNDALPQLLPLAV